MSAVWKYFKLETESSPTDSISQGGRNILKIFNFSEKFVGISGGESRGGQ